MAQMHKRKELIFIEPAKKKKERREILITHCHISLTTGDNSVLFEGFDRVELLIGVLLDKIHLSE